MIEATSLLTGRGSGSNTSCDLHGRIEKHGTVTQQRLAKGRVTRLIAYRCFGRWRAEEARTVAIVDPVNGNHLTLLDIDLSDKFCSSAARTDRAAASKSPRAPWITKARGDACMVR